MTEPVVVRVAQLNNYVARLIDTQSALSQLHVRGEISNFKRYQSGHLYFSLKDETAVVSCVMFRGNADKLRFKPKDGDEVILDCRAGFYERDGKFQLYANQMTLTGLGNLFEAFEALRKKLAAEGLFAPERKKTLRLLPRKIGVVTSPSGAVIRDIIHVATRRFPNIPITLYPCQVQGEGAAATVIAGIKAFHERGDCDVLIIGRGGGSMEDLWAFNDEALARTIAASSIPIISAVGHETDFTIADFVADLRAPTPSAAAELAVPVKAALTEQISQQNVRLVRALRHLLEVSRLRFETMAASAVLKRPLDRIEGHRQQTDMLQDRMYRALTERVRSARSKLSNVTINLDALSPLKVLARGYGLVTDENQVPVTGVAKVKKGDALQVRLADGSLHCVIDEVVAMALPGATKGE